MIDMEIDADVLEAQLQATLNLIPAYTWYAAPSGGLTFVNERCADYFGLPKDHPLRFGAGTCGAWESQIPVLTASRRSRRDAESVVRVSQRQPFL